SPRKAMPTTIPTTVAWAKIRMAIPITAATIQSARMEPSLIRLTPLNQLYYLCVASGRPVDFVLDGDGPQGLFRDHPAAFEPRVRTRGVPRGDPAVLRRLTLGRLSRCRGSW